MKRTFALSFGVIAWHLCMTTPGAFAKDEKILLVSPNASKSFSLGDLKKKLKVVSVTIDDPVYKTKKSFDGFDLDQVLQLLGPIPKELDEIVFQAKDGYAPSMAVAKAFSKKAVLAFQERGTKQKFGLVQQGKARVTPAPYYVVWLDGKDVGEGFPWPYQLAKIELVSFRKKYAKIYPHTEEPISVVMRGFLTFTQQCIACHSINLMGGDIGPELNIPKNITEYWDRDTLEAFIKQADSFRAKSKMPSFANILKDEDIENLVKYLGYMKGHKVSLSP